MQCIAKVLKRPIPVIVFFGCLLFLSAFTQAKETPSAYAPGEIIIGWKNQPTDQSAHLQKKAIPTRKIQRLGKSQRYTHRYSLLKLQDKASMAEALAGLRGDPAIAFAEPNYLIRAAGSDPDMAQQWYLPSISAEQAWSALGNAVDCRQVVIAVVDTGADLDHPDLQANLWLNPGEIADDGIDNDGNGVIDDVHGFDARLWSDDDSGRDNPLAGSPQDDNGHGSHVAGVIGALTNNDIGIAGLCWRASIMPVRFLGGRWGEGNTADAIEGIDYALQQLARLQANEPGLRMITNNSWTMALPTIQSQALREVLATAESMGVLLTAAAGNDGRHDDQSNAFPAALRNDYDNVISVANITQSSELNQVSNYGISSVDIAAPGTDILSLDHQGGYKTLSGTSQATPLVSGLAAILWQQRPDFSPQQLKAALLRHSQTLDSLKGRLVVPASIDALSAVNNIGQDTPALFRAQGNGAGQPVDIFGYGLEQVESLSFNGNNLSYEINSNRQLRISLPTNAKPGYLRAESSAGPLNRLFIPVAIAPPDQVELQSVSAGIQISWNAPGNAESIIIERAAPAQMFQALARVPASPGVFVDQTAMSPAYQYRLRSSLDYQDPISEETIAANSDYRYLDVNWPEPKITWLSQALGSARINRNYSIDLLSNSDSAVRYHLVEGSRLPSGLTLGEDGSLTGMPNEAGNHRFTIVAEIPGQGWPQSREFSLDVDQEDQTGLVTVGNRNQRFYSILSDSGQLQSLQWRVAADYEDEITTMDPDILRARIELDGDSQTSALLDISLAGPGQLTVEEIRLQTTSAAWEVLGKQQGTQQSDTQFSFSLADNGPYDLDSKSGLIEFELAIRSENQLSLASSNKGLPDLRCFIASVLYPTSHPALKTLRDFRDQWLLSNPLGQVLVDYYYHYSPRLAWWLKNNPALQSPVKAILTSIVFLINHPLWGVFSLSLIIIICIMIRFRHLIPRMIRLNSA